MFWGEPGVAESSLEDLEVNGLVRSVTVADRVLWEFTGDEAVVASVDLGLTSMRVRRWRRRRARLTARSPHGDGPGH